MVLQSVNFQNSRFIKLSVMALFLLTLACNALVPDKRNKFPIVFLDTPLLNSGECETVKHLMKCDTNIYLINGFSNSPYKFDSLSHCFKMDICIYGTVLSLDSTYYSNIENKQVLYTPGFVGGNYEKNKNTITVELQFLNPSINTAKSTGHSYIFLYDLERKKITKSLFSFVDI